MVMQLRRIIMTNQRGLSGAALCSNFRLQAFAPTLLCMLTMVTMQSTQAQTLNVLFAFTGGIDIEYPGSGVTLDRAGNLYGTTFGLNNGGGVYELMRRDSSWIFKPLYNFQAQNYDGQGPDADVVFGPDGALYGTTFLGGYRCDFAPSYCGTVYSLRPSPGSFCGNAFCFWNETHVYRFGLNRNDGYHPNGPLVFDSAGNIYGTTSAGGLYNWGTAFQLFRTQNGWGEKIIDNLPRGLGEPSSGLTFDAEGNLFGAAGQAGYDRIYELVHTGQEWNEQTIYIFQGSNNGVPTGLIFDGAGNAYGATSGIADYQAGTVYQLTPQPDGTWRETVLHVFDLNTYGPMSNLAMDAAGNLYGTTPGSPGNNDDKWGMVFELSPVNGSWTFTQIYHFTNGADGAYPGGGVTLDSAGNLYGTCEGGGAYGKGTIWEITP
jgi:uncharacterized repeat protein (TIGR03803 family)